MKSLLLRLAGLCLLWWMPACATNSPDALTQTPFSLTDGNNLKFQSGENSVTVRRASVYSNYRPVPLEKYSKFRVPANAHLAVAGRNRDDYDVVYSVDSTAYWKIYGFTFGKFDIEWPPQLLAVVSK